MINDLEDLEPINDKLIEEVTEIDYTGKTVEIKNKLVRKIRIVFISSIIILITSLITKHNDFDVVLKSDIFLFFLFFTIVLAVIIVVFMAKTKNLNSKLKVFTTHKKFLDIFELLTIVPVFMVILTVSNVFMVSPSFIDGASMEPNYYDGDNILFWHLNVEYERYDVVILQSPGGNYWIKRIIGVPGDRVILDNGIVYVNGDIINQDFLIDENGSVDDYTVCRTEPTNYCVFNVLEDEYFVLGDNRSLSDDSRSDNLGFVTEDQLFGKVILKFNNIFND